MIFWQSKPNKLFKEVIEESFRNTLSFLNFAIRCDDPDCQPVFDEEEVDMFGGLKLLKNHIYILSRISADPEKVYQVSDYSYLLLDRMVSNFCHTYNEAVKEVPGFKYRIRICNQIIHKINMDRFIDMFFWDQDYDFPRDYFNRFTMQDKESVGFNDEAFGVINRMMPHPDELLPVQVTVDPDTWEESVPERV